MHNHGKKKILAVVDDLLFTVKISDAAKRAGLEAEFVKSEKDVMEKAAHEKPLLIILDLNNNSVQPLELIAKLKSDGDLRHISLIDVAAVFKVVVIEQRHFGGPAVGVGVRDVVHAVLHLGAAMID